jgi:hypothetical protein
VSNYFLHPEKSETVLRGGGRLVGGNLKERIKATLTPQFAYSIGSTAQKVFPVSVKVVKTRSTFSAWALKLKRRSCS